MKLDPTSLKLFISVVEAGTIAAAAARWHIAPTAVTRRLSGLEALFGVGLLRRTNRGVEPTEAGLALLGLAKDALQSLDEVYLCMRGRGPEAPKPVRVLADLSAITEFLPREMAAFLAAHPAVKVQLEESSGPGILEALAGGAAELGVCVSAEGGEGLEVLPYRRDRLALVVPGEHALARRPSVSFRETLDFPYVGFWSGSAINLQLVKAASELERPLKLSVRVASYDALCRMVGAGLGIGVLPETVADEYAGTFPIRVIRLDEPWAGRELKIYVRRYQGLPAAARLLVDYLRDGARPLRALAIAFEDRDFASQES